MADDESQGPPFQWESKESLPEGAEEPETANWVKQPGQALVTYPNGDTFEGSFSEAKLKEGKGTYLWKTDAPEANAWAGEGFPEDRVVKYVGEYKEGKKHGLGQLFYPNGDRYHGMFDSDNREGEGTYYYANGDIYSGNWTKDVKSGKGAYVFGRDDSQLVGEWENGTITNGKWEFKDGTVYLGSFKNSKPIGRGVYVFPNGNQQEGEHVEVGDPEDDEAEITLEWRGGVVTPANTSAADARRAPLPSATA